MSVERLADIMTGAIPSTGIPLSVIISTFSCFILKNEFESVANIQLFSIISKRKTAGWLSRRLFNRSLIHSHSKQCLSLTFLFPEVSVLSLGLEHRAQRFFYILLTDRLAVRISDRAHVYVHRCKSILLYGSLVYSVDELLSQKNRKHYLMPTFNISVTAVSFLIQIYSARIGKSQQLFGFLLRFG